MKNIPIKINIKKEDIENLLYSCDTGCSYWAESKLGYEKEVKKLMSGKFGVIVKDVEGSGNYILTLDKIKKGLAVMADKEPSHFGDIISNNTDQITSDVLLQCCLFGEVIYE